MQPSAVFLLWALHISGCRAHETCCWCGKRYEPLPGYWEGSDEGVPGDRIEVDLSAGSLVVVVPPSDAAPGEQRVVVEHLGQIILNATLPTSPVQHYHSFAIDRGVEGHVNAVVLQKGKVVYRSRDLNVLPPPRSRPMVDPGTGAHFPFGWFVNYGGWLQGRGSTGDAAASLQRVGTVSCPVAPFEPGGAPRLEELLDAAPAGSWIFDLKRATDDEVAAAVRRFAGHRALRGWYIADEPDGPGDLPGAPLGFQRPRDVRRRRDLVASLDPHGHPTFASLNCLRAAPLYADAADALLLDPYPVGIDLSKGCNATFGVNGCDGCRHGGPADVAERFATAAHELAEAAAAAAAPPPPDLWAVLQAFGGEGHWSRAPTAMELRASVYLALLHGARGVLLWLREGTTPPALEREAAEIREELDTLAPWITMPATRRLREPYGFDPAMGRSRPAAEASPCEVAQWGTAPAAAGDTGNGVLTLVVHRGIESRPSPFSFPAGSSAGSESGGPPQVLLLFHSAEGGRLQWAQNPETGMVTGTLPPLATAAFLESPGEGSGECASVGAL